MIIEVQVKKDSKRGKLVEHCLSVMDDAHHSGSDTPKFTPWISLDPVTPDAPFNRWGWTWRVTYHCGNGYLYRGKGGRKGEHYDLGYVHSHGSCAPLNDPARELNNRFKDGKRRRIYAVVGSERICDLGDVWSINFDI